MVLNWILSSIKLGKIMFRAKKWKCYLFCCLLFFACKSTDCGCPMAEIENTSLQEIKQYEKEAYHKEWKTVTKQ